MTNQTITSKFTSSYNKGFTMAFANQLCISVQWGTGNYCERRSYTSDFTAEMKQPVVQSTNAEIMIWHVESGEEFLFTEGRTVKGWVEADEVAHWIAAVASAKDLQDLNERMNLEYYQATSSSDTLQELYKQMEQSGYLEPKNQQ